MQFMEVAKLGKRGQVSIPKAVLRRLGIEGEALFLVETTPDGAILLRPAGVYPIELYDDQRIEDLREEDRLTPWEAKRLKAKTSRRK